MKTVRLCTGRNGWIDVAMLCRTGAHKPSFYRHTSVCLALVVEPVAAPPASQWFKSISLRDNQIKKTPIKGAFLYDGRNGWIRTTDLCDPNAAFYQAELRSVRNNHISTQKKIRIQAFFSSFGKKIYKSKQIMSYNACRKECLAVIYRHIVDLHLGHLLLRFAFLRSSEFSYIIFVIID